LCSLVIRIRPRSVIVIRCHELTQLRRKIINSMVACEELSWYCTLVL
jgi:hypothetical protein